MPNPPDNFASKGQYPLNAVGPKGQNAFVGSAQMFFTGSTGLIATFFGVPGVSATRVRTGIYNLQYPLTKEVSIYPALQGPTGAAYNLNIVNVQPFSGTAELHVSQVIAPQIASGSNNPSATVQLQNPISGTRANLLFFVSPIAQF